MKKQIQICLAALFVAVAVQTHAADVTVYDSVVSLATNLTKNYTFTDGASGQNVVIALTMSAYSPFTNASTFQTLDSNTRVGMDFGNGFSDGRGVNFSAALISYSSGVTAGTIKFRITGLGVRAADGSGTANWTSSASTISTNLTNFAEIIVSLDTNTVALGYSAQLRFPGNGLMQLTDVPAPGQSVVLNATFTATNTVVDPRTNSWFTTYSAKYARIYTNDAMKTAGNSLTTWSKNTLTQANPAYCGVQEIYSSSNWFYIRSTGLGAHIMGPWQNGAFPNLPINQKALWKFPRTPSVATTNTQTSLGTIGLFADGVAMFDSADGYVWTGSVETNNGTGYWHREAYANEGATFDPGYAHQEQSGTHHYHANPPALRYELGDHVDYSSSTKTYSESTNTTLKHSPILGWVRDGYPIYGPYAYSNALNTNSPIIKMRSGFQLRNGSNGTDVLVNTARTNLPVWAKRLYGTNSAGPSNFTTYPLARYMEDYAYLGDLTNSSTGTNYMQNVEYDLDEHNGRFCYTPEFPAGTYAYFVSMETNGTPKYPNNIGRTYYGNPAGSSVSAIIEIVTTNFLGNTNAAFKLGSPVVSNSTVTLTWSAIEGGTYQVQSTTNFQGWTTNASNLSPNQIVGSYTNLNSGSNRSFRVARTSVATYDGTGPTIATNSVSPGGSAVRGAFVYITITLGNTPPLPPAGPTPTNAVLAGTIIGSNIARPATNLVTATFLIPTNAATGSQNLVVSFNPAPSYTNTFTITP